MYIHQIASSTKNYELEHERKNITPSLQTELSFNLTIWNDETT